MRGVSFTRTCDVFMQRSQFASSNLELLCSDEYAGCALTVLTIGSEHAARKMQFGYRPGRSRPGLRLLLRACHLKRGIRVAGGRRL